MNSAPLPSRRTRSNHPAEAELDNGTAAHPATGESRARKHRPGLAAAVRGIQDGRAAVRRW
ncbi:hypothetical protein HLB23_27215 [Nocardia uniformis]|uniref:Uncharacterized protein n=1 Tax=Nocardia uniformis TaxID=53432 RepID=A0A849C484_9NOCA|nr:hypothetical protein [Nocardia uniformis]NNH73503.1 hypothetical protein [Nocardia uniformis]